MKYVVYMEYPHVNFDTMRSVEGIYSFTWLTQTDDELAAQVAVNAVEAAIKAIKGDEDEDE